MAVSEFYTANDLLVRRVKMAEWICSQLKKFVNYYHYGQSISRECIMHQEYMVALLESIECYTPITLTAEDGVNNCLTEAKLDKVFNNVEDITGLCFLAKGTTYSPNYDASVPLLQVTLNNGTTVVQTNALETVELNTNQIGIK